MRNMYRDLVKLTSRHANDRVASPIRELTTAEMELVVGGDFHSGSGGPGRGL